MSSDAQALVRQLTENPEVLESMQHMLSLLRANPPKVAQSTTTTATAAAAAAPPNTQRARPPRNGYVDDTLANNRSQRYGVQHDNAYSSADDRITAQTRAYYAEADSRDRSDHASGAPSPVSTFADPDRRGRRASASSRPSHRTTNPVDSGELLAATQNLVEAQRRITDLEKELQRTTQRVDQLSHVVHKQKEELQEAQDRHLLEMEETRQAYDAMVRRKDEVQEEALRQLMMSRQLMLSAAKYEAVVAAKRLEKENMNRYRTTNTTVGDAAALSRGPDFTAGLSASETAINTRHSTHFSSSGVKRERADDHVENGTTPLPKDVPYIYSQQAPAATKRTVSDSWGTPTGAGRARQEKSSHTSYAKTESPEFITSPTPIGKSSTALVGGARTQSRSARKRRTPRTPSLTNADRMAATHPRKPSPQYGDKLSGSAASQRHLPGTTSLKLDSPTPVVSTAWTAGRSMTGSLTPSPVPFASSSHPASGYSGAPTAGAMHTAVRPQAPPPAATASSFSSAATTTKHALTQRTAGRLPAPPLALSRAVPNTRSGTSSVVADGPTRSPSPVNPKRGNPGPRRFVFTGLKDGEPQKLSTVIARVGDDAAVLASELDEVPPTSTTHIVLRGTPRSVKALCGVVSGKWLVSPEYIVNSEESGFWLDEVEEGGLRIFPPPLRGQRFLLTVEHDGIRGKLAQVIAYGGGEVLPMQSGRAAQDVVVITSGDDLLRYATEGHS